MANPPTSDDKGQETVRATRPQDRATDDKGIARNKRPSGKQAQPPPKQPPSVDLRLTLILYPDVATEPTEQVLKDRAIAWVNEDPVHRAKVGISTLAEAFITLELMAKTIGDRTKNRNVGPFISELHILGHGNPGEFEIGNNMYDAAYLKKLDKGKGEKYFNPNAKIYLDGCLTAKGPGGKEFMYQIGRVFLGEKHGFIQGNTREVAAYGHMVTQDPVRIAYPENVVVPAGF